MKREVINNNKPLSEKEIKVFRFIRNSLIHKGISPSVRDVMDELRYKSPNSANFVIQKLIQKGLITRKSGGNFRILENVIEKKDNARTIEIPLVGVAPCGQPLLAEENIDTTIPVSESLIDKGFKYFFLKAMGDSMDKVGIKNGDFVLVRQQPTAKDGDRVVALIDDEATIKEIHFDRNFVVLRPKSSNKKHKSIILEREFVIQGVVAAVLPKALKQ